MPDIIPSQLAEGARLLAENLEARGLLTKAQTQAALIDWFWANRVTLLSSAQRVAKVEWCVREIAAKLQWCAQLNADGLENNPGSPHYRSRKEAFDDAVEYVREIAAEHNIDLSEPGTKEAICRKQN